MKKKLLSLLLTVCMVLSMLPMSAFAEEGDIPIGASSLHSGAPVCENHLTHDEVCGHVAAVEGTPCSHLNEDGSYSCAPEKAAEEYVCPHDDGCGYVEVAKGSDCNHSCEICMPTQQETCICDPVIEDEGVHTSKDCPLFEEKKALECSCKTKCSLSDEENEVAENINTNCPVCSVENVDLALCTGLVQQQPLLMMARGGGSIENETTANGQYHLSYFMADNTIKPTVSGTDNAPVLTFERDAYRMSGGVITSNYTMDFTRSFNIEGSVSAAERDGVSFALHTTKNKTSFNGGHNTGMMGENLLQTWNKSTTSFTVTSGQSDIENGLLWDFMTYNNSYYYTDRRFHKGAYSYQIENTTTVKALPDDTSDKLGMKSYTQNTLNGDFKLSWQCTDSSSATGNLTLQMGSEIIFTYTNIDASSVFGELSKAKAVYFSFATFMPAFTAGGDGTETITKTQISIDKAYYTDTDDGNGKSTLGVETSYYIDTDNNGTYETQLKKATLVGPNQTVLCRNKIYNKNKNATSAMDMTLLIPNLSKVTSSTDTKIAEIGNQNFYLHATGAISEILDNDKMSSYGIGPLNSTAPLTNYVKVTLPAGGNGTNTYEDAYSVYEYTFTPGEAITAFNQTIQLGVAPFTPALLSSMVFFNSPEAFKPDNAGGKILFGTDSVGNNGLYRVVAKDNTSVTLFYNDADIIGGGMAQSTAVTWLNGDFWNMLTLQEQAALLPYGVDSITEKVVIPSENEVKNNGTWEFDGAARATDESGQPGTNWWLRTAGNNDNTAKAVTQNGTQIVNIETTKKNGIRPTMRLNLANVLFTKDNGVNLTNSPSANLEALSAVGKEEAPFRLTLIDTSRNFAVSEDNSSINVSVGDVITFNYTDATVGTNCYVSALLTNSTGQDIYYGRIKAISTDTDANGTARVIIPSIGLGNGNYTLKLFSETIDAAKASDVSSALQCITLELGNNLNGTVSVTGTAEYGCALTATVTNSNYLGTLKYQWKRNGNAIAGATDSSYILTADDIGEAITCSVTDSGESTRDNFISSMSVTIEKRTLIAKADNKQITTGQTLPNFTVTYSGLVNDDTVDNVFADTPTSSVAQSVDGKTSGTFPITVMAELVKDKDNLYKLFKQDGTLTVSSSGGGSSYDYYEIKITKEGKGTTSPDGSSGSRLSVREHSDRTFTFTPDKGYVVSDILVDGKSIGAKASYTFKDVTKDHTLKVIFKTTSTHTNPQTGVDFKDVTENDWFYSSVENAVNKGWFGGTSKTTFSPYNNTTRGMIATVLWRMENEATASVASIFKDVANDAYYFDGATWAQENSIVNGYGNCKFGPQDNITREQLASILYRYAQFKGYDVSRTASLDSFTDGGSVSAYATKTMKWAVGANLISGKGNRILDPKGFATRGQVAAILTRFNELFLNQ